MKAQLILTKLEVAAMIEENIKATWPCPPGHKWEASWKSYDDEIKVEAVKIEVVAEGPVTP